MTLASRIVTPLCLSALALLTACAGSTAESQGPQKSVLVADSGATSPFTPNSGDDSSVANNGSSSGNSSGGSSGGSSGASSGGSSGSSSGDSSVSPSDDSSVGSDGGGCPSTCSVDSDCNSCAAPASGSSNCCSNGACYLYSGATCPAPTDAGTE